MRGSSLLRRGQQRVAAHCYGQAGNALQLAATTRLVTQRYGEADNVLQLATVAMASNTTTYGTVATMATTRCSVFFFFFTRQLQKKKKMGEREKF